MRFKHGSSVALFICSGGQKVNLASSVQCSNLGLTVLKARITLARAVYSPADILLLDDVSGSRFIQTSSQIYISLDFCFPGSTSFNL